MDRIMFAYQNDNNFFDIRRPRIQSEMNVLSKREEVQRGIREERFGSFRKMERPQPRQSVYSNRSRISMAHTINSDQIINEEAAKSIIQKERLRKMTHIMITNPIQEVDDNDQQSAKSNRNTQNTWNNTKQKRGSDDNSVSGSGSGEGVSRDRSRNAYSKYGIGNISGYSPTTDNDQTHSFSPNHIKCKTIR
eukprot:403336021